MHQETSESDVSQQVPHVLPPLSMKCKFSFDGFHRSKCFYVCLENTYVRRTLVIFVYLSPLPVAHLSDAPRRRLVVTGDSARTQDETTENSAWFFKVLGV